MMVQVCIAALTLMTLAILSFRANGKFKQQQRLPMQWSSSGAVNWTAPRPLALAFTPLLAAGILIYPTIATVAMTPRPGQEGVAIPIIAVMSLGFVAAHALHLWLIGRMLKDRS